MSRPKKPLTKRQRDALRFIREFLAKEEMAPTLREIGEALDCSGVAAKGLVDRLIDKGYVRRRHGEERGLTLTRG